MSLKFCLYPTDGRMQGDVICTAHVETSDNDASIGIMAFKRLAVPWLVEHAHEGVVRAWPPGRGVILRRLRADFRSGRAYQAVGLRHSHPHGGFDGGRVTPFRLLDDDGLGLPASERERLWVEYCTATTRRRCFTWSHGADA